MQQKDNKYFNYATQQFKNKDNLDQQYYNQKMMLHSSHINYNQFNLIDLSYFYSNPIVIKNIQNYGIYLNPYSLKNYSMIPPSINFNYNDAMYRIYPLTEYNVRLIKQQKINQNYILNFLQRNLLDNLDNKTLINMYQNNSKVQNKQKEQVIYNEQNNKQKNEINQQIKQKQMIKVSISILKQLCQKLKFKLQFVIQDNSLFFNVSAFISGNKFGQGTANSKRVAKEKCAANTLKRLSEQNPQCEKILKGMIIPIKQIKSEFNEIQYNPHKNYKYILNEFVHKKLKSTFTYSLIQQKKNRIAILKLKNMIEKGSGKNQNSAKNQAAFLMYKRLKKMEQQGKLNNFMQNKNFNKQIGQNNELSNQPKKKLKVDN